MGKLHGFANVIGEFVRTTADEGNTVEVELTTLATNRARASAHFSVIVRLPWLTEHDIQFVTQRGYIAQYTYKAVTLWLIKNLPSLPCSLIVKVPDASTMPPKWTDGRIHAQEARIAALNPSSIRDAAAAKADTVKDWATSQRKAETLSAARAMSEAAAMIDVLRGGAEWPTPDDSWNPGTTPGGGGTGGNGGTDGNGNGGTEGGGETTVSINWGNAGNGTWGPGGATTPGGAEWSSDGGTMAIINGALRPVPENTLNSEGAAILQPVGVPANGAQRLTVTVRPPDDFGTRIDPLVWARVDVDGLSVLFFNYEGAPMVRIECGYFNARQTLEQWEPGHDVVASVEYSRAGIAALKCEGKTMSEEAQRWTNGTQQMIVNGRGNVAIKAIKLENI